MRRSEPPGIELHHCLGDVQAGFPVRDLRVNAPAHLQHVRVGAQGCVYQLQLFIRLLMVAQLHPALCGLQVECIWRLERFHGGENLTAAPRGEQHLHGWW